MEYSYQSWENDFKYKSKPSLTLKKKNQNFEPIIIFLHQTKRCYQFNVC